MSKLPIIQVTYASGLVPLATQDVLTLSEKSFSWVKLKVTAPLVKSWSLPASSTFWNDIVSGGAKGTGN